ncbi:MAG: DUF2520 domain-containing protein [Chloroflexota bacterium]|nr:DUF2520 domain-containing protein [Chloroflexota bacterium]
MRDVGNIGIIGSGKLGKALGLCLHNYDYRIVSTIAQSYRSADWLASRIPRCKIATSPQEVVDAADFVFITTPDTTIADVTDSVTWNESHSVIQCSGSKSISVLQSASDSGAGTATFHPYQTFSQNIDETNINNLLSDATITITSDNISLQEDLCTIAANLGARPAILKDYQRPLYHASAVLSCGALTALLNLSLEIWISLGFSESDAIASIYPLAQKTLNNVRTTGTLNSLTGPIPRGDLETLRLHFEALLPFSTTSAAVYSLLSLVGASINEPNKQISHTTPAAQLIENEFIQRLFP